MVAGPMGGVDRSQPRHLRGGQPLRLRQVRWQSLIIMLATKSKIQLCTENKHLNVTTFIS